MAKHEHVRVTTKLEEIAAGEDGIARVREDVKCVICGDVSTVERAAAPSFAAGPLADALKTWSAS